MNEGHEFDRRRFLYGAAAGAGAVTIAACSTGETDTGGERRNGEPAGERDEGKGGKKPGQEGSTTGSATEPLPTPPFFRQALLHWLNDGLDIGPGLVESWESNDDASEWTFHFRKGLKWSDGHPWTTADVMFWWEDLVLNEESPEVAPDECKSAKGTLVDMTAPDDRTLVMHFDTPAPITPGRLADWPNRPGGRGPIWMEPKHYVQQFHPKYNPDAPKDWAAAGGAMEMHANFRRSTDCPTMTGWRLTSYREGRGVTMERNPYYWAVDRDGAQLPYIDTLSMSVVQDPEVVKLRIQHGKADHVQGNFLSISLADVSTLKKAEKSANIDVLLWDSGSGGGSDFYFNYDYPDKEWRELIREPKFRQALSYAFNRDLARKVLYFNTGEPTTGTMSPKASEFHAPSRGSQVYRRWRDCYVEYRPKKAEAMLDELGVVDSDGDGKRELPSGVSS